MRIVWGRVKRIIDEREGLQRLEVAVAAEVAVAGRAQGSPDAGSELRRAMCYPHITGAVRVGDRVAINTTACDLALGTGGWDFVTCVDRPDPIGEPPVAPVAACAGHAAVPASPKAESPAASGAGLGHTIKLRYTPCQVNVMCAEEQDGELHDVLREADDCCGMPVACCELHSQAMAACVAISFASEGANPLRIAYIMTDEAALDIHVSHICRQLTEAGIIWRTITCGQALGGEVETVSLHSALLSAHAMGADVAVASQGPGIMGTGTRFGTSAVAQGEAINACACLNARAVAPLRVSFADARPRHRGLSDHSAVALGRVSLASAIVAVPAGGCRGADAAGKAVSVSDKTLSERLALVDRQACDAGIWKRHERREVEVTPEVLQRIEDAGITTMGRMVSQDPEFFAASAAAGIVAAQLACSSDNPSGGVREEGCR
jgi:hypothetical protein